MATLYHPQTGEPRQVPDIDAPAWQRIHGYTADPPALAEAVPPKSLHAVIPAPVPLPDVVPPAAPDALPLAVARLDELRTLYDAEGAKNWRAIKAIADGLGIAKPADGWDAAILLIIEAEFSAEIAAAVAEGQ